MEVARSLAVHGAPSGAVVLAEEQEQGRGRLSRRWFSPPGVNLYLSIVLRPTLERLPVLAMIAPLAVVDGVRTACGLECTLKWPNDVQVKGRKLAGVLVESELIGGQPELAIAGVGINVNYDSSGEPEIAEIATSTMRETGAEQERELLLARFLEAFERWYEAPVDEIRSLWRARLTTLGQTVRVVLGQQVEEGLAEDVTGDGSLILRRTDGSCITLPAGEVTLRA